jgi:alkanesulfonate monooxygenase SsuD/methylene tetrahydromethanopterin reductase-like flavin-dependent oxidoreductase (luciferase family)
MARWQTVPASLQRFRPEMVRSAEAYDFSRHLSLSASHPGAVSDELAAALAVVGSVAECVERLGPLAELKPDRITMALLSGGRSHRLAETLEVWRQLTRNGDHNRAKR